MILVNAGCGRVHHPDWVNLDFAPDSPGILRCDLREGLPFSSTSVDVVYSSHVLEHLDKAAGHHFLKECHRVLRPGGILRVAVPDFEGLVRAYIEAVDAPGEQEVAMLEWLRIELIDQFARSSPGGEMAPFAESLTPMEMERVRGRIGLELESMVEKRAPARSLWARLLATGPRRMVRRIHERGTCLMVKVLGGPRLAAAFDEGLFRASGEVHRAVYDRFVLKRVMDACGFMESNVMEPGQSDIPRFPEFDLEIERGIVRKPDSLIMEATRA
jgi:SAM-dependent methyltransferase